MKYIIVEGFAHLVKFGIKPLFVNSIFLHLVFQRILSNLRALNASVVLCFANDISLGRFLKILATNCFRKKLVSSERQGNEISWSIVTVEPSTNFDCLFCPHLYASASLFEIFLKRVLFLVEHYR